MVHASHLALLLAVLATASLSTAAHPNNPSATTNPAVYATPETTIDPPVEPFLDNLTKRPAGRYALRDLTASVLGKRKICRQHNAGERVSALGKGWVVWIVAMAVGIVAVGV